MLCPAVVLVPVALLAAVAAVAGQARPPGEPDGGRRRFTVVEATISELQTAMEQRRVTSRAIVEQYLTRIALYEDRLNAIITVYPGALREAEERDRERAQGKLRGPLHGIPIALKDNIHTTNMPTTGGALAFDGFVPPYEATLTRNLREAGAIILAKTVMTELANWVASGMPANYSALKGYGMNPYDPRRDPRDATFDGRPALATGGSSSGIGIPRANFYDKATPPGATEPRGGLNEDQARVMAEAIAVLKQQGAVVVDPADIPSVVAKEPGDNFLSWSVCSGLDNAKGKDAGCSGVFKYGMKRDFDAWLATLGPKAPVKTLTELRQWNVAHQKAAAIKDAQAQLDISDEMDLHTDRSRYESDREKDLRLSATQGIDAVMKENRLDAILFPGGSGAAIAAKPGYPTVIVPFGFVPNAPAA